MDQSRLEAALADLSLGAVRYLPRVGSTNDEAARWIAEGAPDLALLVADEQTAGRGRAGRHWLTPPGVALAFSLALYPPPDNGHTLPRTTALGALAVCDALRNRYNLPAQIKWPNDVLVARRKLAGVLTEMQWLGEQPASLVLGIGINVAPASVPPESTARFPATCVETALGRPVDRLQLLHDVLASLLRWRPRLSTPDFTHAWEDSLAFRGEWVQISIGDGPPFQQGVLVGLVSDGALKLRTASGEMVTVQVGEVRLRPVEKAVK